MVPSERAAPSTERPVTRRRLLGTVGAAVGVSTAGCSGLLPSGREGEGDTIEVLVENRSPDPARIGVLIEDTDGEPLFSRVYELDPQQLDQSAGIETRPATVFVFTPDGAADEWEYAPDLDIDCEGEDIGISLEGDGTFESWYAC